MKLHDRLKKKGWTKKEIDKTIKIIDKAKKNKHPHIKILDKIVFWIGLIIAILGNFIIAVALIPLLLGLSSFTLYLLIITLGVCVGLLFELLVRSMTHLEKKHHLFFGSLIPVIAIINIFIIAGMANFINRSLLLFNQQNSFLVAIVYAIAFIAPFCIYHLFLKE